MYVTSTKLFVFLFEISLFYIIISRSFLYHIVMIYVFHDLFSLSEAIGEDQV